MSKLFDQLKKAARIRRDRSPGLLLEALQKAQQQRDGPAAPAGPAAPRPGPIVAPEPPGVAPSRPSAYSGAILAIAIFAIVVLAWYAAPWRAPEKVKIDPTDLKLDRSLDLQRPTPKGTSSPPRPS